MCATHERQVNFLIGAMRRALLTLETGRVDHLECTSADPINHPLTDPRDPANVMLTGAKGELKEAITAVVNRRV
jgi:hypothetical protein